MTDHEALTKAREWFGPNAVARIGTERGGTAELYVGVETGDAIHAHGTGRTWEECFANVPELYRPADATPPHPDTSRTGDASP